MSNARSGPDRVDLHVHSCFSDGTLTPAELLHLASSAGLTGLAITDHDSVAAYADTSLHLNASLTVITGLELSTQFQNVQELHLLGYMFDPDYPELVKELRAFRQRREQRAAEIVTAVNRALARQGQRIINAAHILSRTAGAVGRPHIAREMIRIGAVHDMDAAFKKFLVPYDRPKALLDSTLAIDLIRRAGGLVSLAHPITLGLSFPALDALLGQLVRHGLGAIEGRHPSMSHTDQASVAELAQRYDLLITGGSDYHGPEWLWELGTCASPAGLLPDMAARAAASRQASPREARPVSLADVELPAEMGAVGHENLRG